MEKINFIKIVPYNVFFKKRLDKVLSILFYKYSRTFLKKIIFKNCVFIDDNIINNPKKKIFGGEIIRLFGFLYIKDFCTYLFNSNLYIVYEDNAILIINKTFDMVIHPSIGHKNFTLLNIILFKYKNLKYIPRAGIIHRLDKNTTGLIIIAKNLSTYINLKKLLFLKKICREYIVFTVGVVISGGVINIPISRNNFKKRSMSVNYINGKKSITHFRIIKKFLFHTCLRVFLETGRTHQIRVHLSYLNFPLIGDKLYNKNLFFRSKNINFKNKIILFPRQAIHAQTLRFFNPNTKQLLYISSRLPSDMRILNFYLENNLL